VREVCLQHFVGSLLTTAVTTFWRHYIFMKCDHTLGFSCWICVANKLTADCWWCQSYYCCLCE